MSLTRAKVMEILSKADVPAEKMDSTIQEIIMGHTASIDALKEKNEELKETAKAAQTAAETAKTELETAKSDLKTAQDALKEARPYKEKYDKEHADFEAFKTDVSGKEAKAKTDKLFTDWLKAQGYSDAGTAKIVKYGGFTPEFDEKGTLKDADKLTESVKAEWGEYANSPVKTEGVQTAQPPATKAGGMTIKEITQIKDPVERMEAWKANPQLLDSNKE